MIWEFSLSAERDITPSSFTASFAFRRRFNITCSSFTLSPVKSPISGDIREDVIGAIEQGASKNDDYLIIAVSLEGTVRNGAGDTIKMELKLETLRNAVQEVNDVISASGNPKVKEEAVKEAVKAINDQVIAEAVEGLRSMEPSQMWPEYLDHQFVPGYAVKADKDTGKYAIILPEEEKASKVRIPFAALDNAGERLSLSGNWADMLRIFCENVVINQSNDMGRAYAARNAMSASWMDKRSKMGAHW